MPDAVASGRSALFFKRQCPPCLRLSRLVVLLSLGTIERVPLDGAQARDFYARHPGLEGMPILLHDTQVFAGAAVFWAVPRVLAARWWHLARLGLGGLRDRKPSKPR